MDMVVIRGENRAYFMLTLSIFTEVWEIPSLKGRRGESRGVRSWLSLLEVKPATCLFLIGAVHYLVIFSMQ